MAHNINHKTGDIQLNVNKLIAASKLIRYDQQLDTTYVYSVCLPINLVYCQKEIKQL